MTDYGTSTSDDPNNFNETVKIIKDTYYYDDCRRPQ